MAVTSQRTIFHAFAWMKNIWISINISLKSVPKGQISNIPALVRKCLVSAKPLSEPMMFSLLMHICITQPQSVKIYEKFTMFLCLWQYLSVVLMLTFFLTYNIDGLVQDCSNSIANTLELLQSCTKPSICLWCMRPCAYNKATKACMTDTETYIKPRALQWVPNGSSHATLLDSGGKEEGAK